VAGIVARLTASFDRIPAVHAFVFMTAAGVLAGFALFGMSPTPALKIQPLSGFLLIVCLALVLVFFSRPVVVCRDRSFVERVLHGLRDSTLMVAFQAAIFISVIVPMYFVKSSSDAQRDSHINSMDSTLAPTSSQRSTAMADVPSPSTSMATAPANSTLTADMATPLPSTTLAPSATASVTTRSTASGAVPDKLPFVAGPKTKDEKVAPPREKSANDDYE
jgi:hypothetical protein